MRRFLLLGLAMGFVGWIAWSYGSVVLPHGAAASAVPNPEDGAIINGRYANRYFDLSYPLPERWAAGLAGPEPSETGYYVLSSLVPAGEQDATILIAAQDMFFAANPDNDLAASARDFRAAMAAIDGMTIDHEPSETTIAGRPMQRVDFSGVGLYRGAYLAEIRCHHVSFNLTARSPERLAELAHSLDGLSHTATEDPAASAPACIKDYAVADNLLQRIEPVPTGPRFTSIPVRIVIDRDGNVKHIHVIHAAAEQRQSIEDALRQWKFKPPRVNGASVEVETGLLFQFTSPPKS
jgi:Gram-negative bacterial TonB protein C-terminal